MGLVDLHASHQLTDLSAFLVRGANSDITMVELNTDGLDFQGLELPVLSRAEMLEQDWDLENSASGKVGDLLPAGEEAAKRGREGEDESMVNKRARTEVEEPTEETVMGPPEELVAEAAGGPGDARRGGGGEEADAAQPAAHGGGGGGAGAGGAG